MLPPVRSPVCLRRTDATRGSAAFAPLFPGYALWLYNSGTTALAIALQDARLRRRCARPEVILPAYGCPQLVSACLHARVHPRIIDTAPDQWGYDLPSLRAALSSNTVAVVAANLLGTGDQAAELLPLVRENGAYLVQDSAQYLPGAPTNWCADYVVLSFGRGKPLNLLRGGALALTSGHTLLAADAAMPSGIARLKEAALGSRAAGVVFNVITHPRIYGLTARLPIGLGETRFAPLAAGLRLPFSVWGQVGPAYKSYSQRTADCPWSAVLSGWRALGIHELTCAAEVAVARNWRLRLALLAPDRMVRDRSVEALNQQGLGASVMYGTAIDAISAIPREVVSQGPFPNATRLADRLFTLPTHGAVTAAVVARADGCLRKVM
jgi:dTDP-4-amino-4,6-dideoxygalactose transaminase